MKISNSKKQLAKIISENWGWREGGMFSAQDQDGEVFFYTEKPSRLESVWRHNGVLGGDWINCGEALPNWHQTVLSRDEYFHLYPAPDAELVAMCADVTKENKHPEYCESVMRSIPEPSDKPTIEQLAADYRSKLAIAQQAQEEADSRRVEADDALHELYQAGLDIGLDIAIASKEDEDEGETELVITDWRDLQVGDEITALRVDNVDGANGNRCVVVKTQDNANGVFVLAMFDDGNTWWVREWRFIRRP